MSTKEPIVQTSVIVGGKRYAISNHPDDNKRRCCALKKYASDKSKFDECESCDEDADLHEDEENLLKDLGIINDSKYDFVMVHAYDLYLFFKEIHNCQTTAALTLNHGCSTAHYILFSVLHQAQEKTNKEFLKLKHPTISTDLLTLTSKKIDSVGNLIPSTAQPAPETKAEAVGKKANLREDTYEEDIFDIFTLEV